MTPATIILMVRPASFGYNAETAANNFFQRNSSHDLSQVNKLAVKEFDNMVSILRGNSIEVLVIDDDVMPRKPDAVFPNNWISTSPEGVISVFPMYAANRRTEKRDDIIQQVASEFEVTELQDWTEYEAEGRFLEGTGSVIIDHDSKLMYACLSERTSLSLLEKYAARNKFQAIVFLATDKNNKPVYHTNVVMSLGDEFCVLCEEAIEEEWELIAVRQLLESTGHVIIPITRDQMHRFAGNMLQLQNKTGEKFIVLSAAAFTALSAGQKRLLAAYGDLLPIAIPTIEMEGGSVRCMMTEIFLKKKSK